MDSPQYGSSGIQWQRTDPKTVTLSNTPDEMQAPPPSQDPSPVAQEMFQNLMDPMTAMGKAMTEDEFKNFSLGMAMRDRSRQPTSEAGQKRQDMREHRKQIRQFDRGFKAGADPQQGIQQLMDSGAIWLTDTGDLYSSVPLPEGMNKRLLDAARTWQPADEQYMQYVKDKGGNQIIPPDPQRDEYHKQLAYPGSETHLKFWNGLRQTSPTSENPRIPEGDYYDPSSRTLTTIQK